jgi:hypothetical protein
MVMNGSFFAARDTAIPSGVRCRRCLSFFGLGTIPVYLGPAVAARVLRPRDFPGHVSVRRLPPQRMHRELRSF